MKHASLLIGFLLLPMAAMAAPIPSASSDAVIDRIAFGSCAKQDKPQPIWEAVNATSPDLFLFLGDNIYGDTEDLTELEAKYAKLAEKPGFVQLRAQTPVMATWDDHDFGQNDAGAEFPMKEPFRQAFLRFWKEPTDSPRWQRDGVYTSAVFGPEGRRVQVILLDLRYNRTPIARNIAFPDDAVYERWARAEAKAGRMVPGPYTRDPDPSATMLGEAQWRWLEEQLRVPADVRLIGSSLQVLADFPGWEAWVNYPRDHARLIDTVRSTQASGVVFLSGDTHYGELSELDANTPYPLYDLTSSGLTEEWHVPVPNALRTGKAHHQANFGMVDVDWATRELTLELRDVKGETLLRQRITLDRLRPRAVSAPVAQARP
jgi:alkaline phosphatase D